jgi:hypothetical protein
MPVAESKKIAMQIDGDARLAAAAGGAARYFADAAGMEDEAIAHLQKATVAACREAFEYLTKDHPHLDVTLTRLAYRIEIALCHQGGTHPGSDAGQATGPSAAEEEVVRGGVDRVQHERRGDVAIIRLTKFVHQTGSGM